MRSIVAGLGYLTTGHNAPQQVGQVLECAPRPRLNHPLLRHAHAHHTLVRTGEVMIRSAFILPVYACTNAPLTLMSIIIRSTPRRFGKTFSIAIFCAW